MPKTILRSIIALFLCFSAIGTVNAQLGQSREYVEPPGWSVGMNIGLLDLWGDVGTAGVLDHYVNDDYWGDPHFMGGVFGRYCAHPALALRLGVSYGTLFANDHWNYSKAKKAKSIEEDAYQRYFRNLAIRANIWEASFMFELSPLRTNVDARIARKRFQPYLLFGVAYMHFNPQAELILKSGANKGWVDLYPLHLEGDGFEFKDAPEQYSLWQIAVPVGLGGKWDIGRNLAIGVEWCYRLTFTDYLDNTSDKYIDPGYYSLYMSPEEAQQATLLQDKSFLVMPGAKQAPGAVRGNPDNNDSYSTFGISLFYKIKSRKMPWWY